MSSSAYAAFASTERRVDDRQCRGQDHRPADALDQPCQDQHPAVGSERRQHRGRGEQRDADEHHPPAPESIGQAPEHQQQGREDEGVRLLHPLHLGRGDPEIIDDRRDGDVDDRRVDDDQRDGDADEDQTDPAKTRVLFHDR